MSEASPDQSQPPITALTKKQRRVLGTLIEKALTVPDSYPLTINSLISGCNQKSNRSPLSNYDETDIEDTLNELRDLGLVAAVLTEGARTEKYRHYVRLRFTLSEPQIGILTELLLRGRQAVGELRTRAARMVPKGSLDTQEQLRSELQGLLAMKLIQADGPLDRRGVEVDHNLYQPQEGQGVQYRESVDDEAEGQRPAPRPSVAAAAPAMSAAAGSATAGTDGRRIAELEVACAALRREMLEVRSLCEELRRQLQDVAGDLERVKRDLGG